MSFNGNEGSQISLAEGAELTGRYRVGHMDSTKAVFYGREHIELLLAQPDCKGIRMYYAQESNGVQTLVLVGTDSNGSDILDVIIENGEKCPINCGGVNPLNSDPKAGGVK